jgi:predicted aspartyl protease
MSRWLGLAVGIALASLAAYAGELSPFGAPSRPSDGFAKGRVAADTAGAGCGTSRIGEITVATLHNLPIVTFLANGVPVTLLLDTGAETTILLPAVARRIGAQPPRVEFDRHIRGLTGSLATSEVELRSFTAGGVPMPWLRVRVASVQIPSVFFGPLDGVLGVDTLSNFDVDLDLPHHRMVFYRKQSCPRAAPAWTEPFETIAVGRSSGDHLFFPVRLDGHRFYAFADTGSQASVLTARAALVLGVTEAALARDRPTVTQGVAADQLSSHLHRFSRLEIGEEVLRNPALIVADVDLSDADLVLGVDFMISRRIWLSYGSQQIFISHQS